MSDIVCQKTYQIMGGEFQFSCFPQNFLSRKDVERLFEDGQREVKRIQDKFTDFNPSDLTKINDAAGTAPVPIDDETFYLLKESLRISQQTKGLFDITFASVGHIWREYKDRGETLPPEMIQKKKQFIDYKLIELNEKEKTVFLPHKEIKIGFGGIGKGYAVDRVFDLFMKRGLYNFYINGAGDIRVHSRPDAPRKWRIGIRNPLSSDPTKSVGVIQLDNGAIASSGGYIHNVNGDKFNHHIINPKTGHSNREIIASTVLAPDALSADTMATVIMNLSLNEAIEFMNDLKLTALFFSADGKSYLSERAMKNFGM